MPLARTSEVVAAAAKVRAAAFAFNVVNLEQIEGVVAGAEAVGLPVIIQVSQNAVGFHDGRVGPLVSAATAAATASVVPVALHLDHVEDLGLLYQAADAGFSSVMYDAARLPYEGNVAATRVAADWGHSVGLWVEAELGFVGGKPDAPQSAHAAGVRTDPMEAADFVRRTTVDALAVAVGSSHAMTTRTATLDHELIQRLAAALNVPLVLHGSSGVPDEELRHAIRAGIRKINVGTALGAAYTRAVRSELGADPTIVDPRKYLKPARQAVAAVVQSLFSAVAE